MYYFYVLYSPAKGRIYKGHTQNVDTRLRQHNQGNTKSTKAGIPWILIYTEEFTSRVEAITREKESKTRKGGRALLKMLNDQGALPPLS